MLTKTHELPRLRPNKQRAVKREVRMLLRALRMIGNPGLGISPNLSPIPERAVLLAVAWRRQAGLSMAASAVSHLRARVSEMHPLLIAREPTYLDDRVVGTLERWGRRYLPQRFDAVADHLRGMTPWALIASLGVRSWADLKTTLERGMCESQAAIHALCGRIQPGATSNILMTEGQGEQGYTICHRDAKTGEQICEKINGTDFWTIVILVIVASFLGWVLKNADEWFNEEDDDKARLEIAGLNCQQIVAKDNAHWISRFGSMIDGPTGDEDEAAMLKVLNCLPCDRVQAVVGNYGVDSFMDEFNGSEWDTLVIRLQQCGLVSFADWDDDATRKFIWQTPASALAYLSITNIVQLCKNMFAGSCGDEDEAAIIHLMASQDPCKVQKILLSHISFDEFDDNVDGEEWDELQQVLLASLPPFSMCT